MRENLVRKKWASGQAALGGWLGVPSAFSAEVMAHAGFDWLCVDMQHGLIDYQQMVSMLQAMAATEVTPLVRVPWNEPGIIGKALDAGALGVIVPMVNSPEEAQAAVAACRYAPQGRRSFGPLRASTHYGSDYFSRANAEVCCIVMIETRQAVERVDEILSVRGIDAVYVGPADLSVTLGLPPGADNADPSFGNALSRIVESCRRHNIVPGIAGNAAIAPKRIEQGFRLCEVASDARLIAAGAAQALQQVRPTSAPAAKAAYL
ncbi:MAG TPA: aldolase/citrate lyase family protein [Candidatus Binataceae bacterium]|nr:aldolase/citrate lyase family protein [Candidatus Binataceae bacterium]